MVFLLACAFVVCASSASAGVVTNRVQAAVKAPELTSAERRAITIASVSVTGDDSLGALVRVTFRGDAERFIGRGNLKRGLLALVLVPVGGGQPVGLINEGGKRVLRVTTGRPAGVVPRGSRVTFYIAGVRLSRFARVELRVLATSPPHASWRQILASKPAEQVSLRVDPSPLTCSQLAALGNQVGSLRDLGTFGGMLGARLAACAAPASVAPPTTTTTATPPPTTTTTPPPPPPAPPVTVVQTDAALSQQLASQPGLDFSAAPAAGVPVIVVNDQVGYQRFSGLGAALTDSAAWLIYDELSSADRTTVMQDLFGPGGIHLNFLRIAMGASGAMTNGPAYSYDDMPRASPTQACRSSPSTTISLTSSQRCSRRGRSIPASRSSPTPGARRFG